MGKSLAFAITLLLIYLVYAPNFLTVKNIKIDGAEDREKEYIVNSINDYLASRAFWPQSNLLLLSKKELSAYLTLKNKPVARVISIEKNFPSTLNVKIEKRYDKFLLKNQSGAYTLSNDGLTGKQLRMEDLSETNTPYSNLIPLSSQKNQQFYEGQRPQDAEYFKNLNEILSLSEKDGRKITGIEIESFEQPNISAVFKEGYRIKFDVNSDLQKIFSQLRLLLKQVGVGRINGIKYIDMRVKDKGYVCYKDAACATDKIEVPLDTTTSSPPTN